MIFPQIINWTIWLGAVFLWQFTIHSVLGANPPHAMAFAVTDEPFDPRTIPESYINLRHIQKSSVFRAVSETRDSGGSVLRKDAGSHL